MLFAAGGVAAALGLPTKAMATGSAMMDGSVGKSIAVADGTTLYYKDWGSGPAVILSHGWPLDADAWDSQMFLLGMNGYRVVAHDRRSHGRSEQTWSGNDMDT